MMTEYEEIMNSGKIYKVMGLTNEDTHYHEYLQMMEKYNSLGYTEEGEKEKQRMVSEERTAGRVVGGHRTGA